MSSAPGKNWTVAVLLCAAMPFLGLCGIHRFYTGHIVIGLLQLLTGGFCGIWQIIDLVLILTGSYKDADGNALVK